MDLGEPQPVNQPGAKHTECPLYDNCLDQAVEDHWDWWSCGNCRNYSLNAVEGRLQYIGQDYGYVLQIYPELREKYERILQVFRCQVNETSPAKCPTDISGVVGRGSQ
jgi:hypothetical protein